MKYLLHPLPLILAGWLVSSFPATAQTGFPDAQREHAEQLIKTSQYDSALLVLDRALTKLTPADSRTSHTGLRIRLTQAEARYRKRDYVEAAKTLLPLIDDSRAVKDYYIQAAASIRMAMMYERQNDPKEGMAYLERARHLIEAYGIHALEPNLFIRRSSYERIYGDTVTAQRYAWQGKLIAEELKDEHQLALAHFHLSLLSRGKDTEASLYHLAQAAEYYHHTGSAMDYLVMTLVLSDLHYRSGNMEEALVTNDSAMVYASRIMDRDSTHLSRVYEIRANIMKVLGEQDSAWHYANLAYASSLEHMQTMASQRAAEVESNYTKEKQSLLIAQQQRKLEYERRRRQWMSWTIALVSLGIGVLYYYYNRLKRVNWLMGEQAMTIREKNDELAASLQEQRMLQGEVHHRVKNNLQIIISLLELQREEMPDKITQDALDAMAGRVYSMVAVHETLYQNGRLGQIEFGVYIRKICDHFCQLSRFPRSCHYTFDLPECWLNLETAVPLGTILNELLTNTNKYALVKNRQLRVSIKLEALQGQWRLTYHDNGPGYPLGHIQDREGGLGSYLLHGMSQQLRGRVVTSNQNGALTQVYFSKKNDYTPTSNDPSEVHCSDIGS